MISSLLHQYEAKRASPFRHLGKRMPDTRTAIDAEKLIGWTIRLQLADLIVEAAEHVGHTENPGHSSDGIYQVLEAARLGVSIEGGRGARMSELPLPPDAEQTYRVMRELLDPPALILVRDCARTDTRPVWAPFAPLTVRPVRVKDYGKRHGQVRLFKTPTTGPWCEFVIDDRREEIEQYRELWRWWHGAIKIVEWALMADQSLERWRLEKWDLPAEPWRRE